MTTILVVRHDDKFSAALREAGFDVTNLELIETRPVGDLSDLRERIAKLSEYDGLFFTSPIAAEIFVEARKGANGFHGNVYALGGRAQHILESAGLNVNSSSGANTADELLSGFGDVEFKGKRLLFVCGEQSLRTIPDRLKDLAAVDEVSVYKTETPEIDQAKLAGLRSRFLKGEIDHVCFFSPSGVERFTELFRDAAIDIKAAAIGTTTADTIMRAGFKVEFISPRSSAEDFAGGLIAHLRQSVNLSQ